MFQVSYLRLHYVRAIQEGISEDRAEVRGMMSLSANYTCMLPLSLQVNNDRVLSYTCG